MVQISKRAQHLLKNLAHLRERQECPWKIEFSESDKILTLSYSLRPKVTDQDIASIFCEVLSIFTKNKDISVIDALTFREVESFLRDENHRRAFEFIAEESAEVEKIFMETKMELFSTAISTLLKKNTSFSFAHFSTWNQRSLVEKNQLGLNFIRAFNSVVPKEKMVEFVYADQASFYVNDNFGSWDVEVLVGLLNSLLAEFAGACGIKVVAVQ